MDKIKTRFWVTDYPLLCYLEPEGKQIVIKNLATPNTPGKIINLEEQHEEFIAFVDKFPNTLNASISFLLKNRGNKIILRTCECSRPFDKNF